MAGQHSDGSIIVDTGIDTSGFDRGSADLRRATESLHKQFRTLGAELQRAFNGYSKAVASGNKRHIRRMAEELKRARDSAANFRRQISAFGATKFKTDEYNIPIGGLTTLKLNLNLMNNQFFSFLEK